MKKLSKQELYAVTTAILQKIVDKIDSDYKKKLKDAKEEHDVFVNNMLTMFRSFPEDVIGVLGRLATYGYTEDRLKSAAGSYYIKTHLGERIAYPRKEEIMQALILAQIEADDLQDMINTVTTTIMEKIYE